MIREGCLARLQRNQYRDVVPLSGIWGFRADPAEEGEARGWAASPSRALEIAVPGSWNEQLAEAGYMSYVGAAWLYTEVFLPPAFAGRRRLLSFGAAGFSAVVYANGVEVGRSSAPYLPFEADVTEVAAPGEVLHIAVRVSNREDPDGVTPAVSRDDFQREGRAKDEVFPATRPDFFPYGGLHGRVDLRVRPLCGVGHVRTRVALESGAAALHVDAEGEGALKALLSLDGEPVAEDASAAGSVRLSVPTPRLWSPATPTLYELTLRLARDGAVVDEVRMPIGLRTVAVEGSRLLLNGEPIFLRGFGRHEDAEVSGRGLNLPYIVKDFGLMRWCGANSFRTSHYPYAEEQLDWADRHGVLVVSELACVNLDFRRVGPATLDRHLMALEAQMARDGGHPSVIMWSLANEPGYLGEPEYNEDNAGAYWDAVFGKARALDPDRPLTMANVQYAGLDDPAFTRCDVIGLNRYHGWYTAPGQIDRGVARVREEMNALAERHGKPIALWEFGADAIAGEHATFDQLFTEEYQADFIAAYLDVAEAHPACIGAHVWNLCDFRTAQHFRRVVVNRKGVFTRDRKPKRAAFMLRDRWTGA